MEELFPNAHGLKLWVICFAALIMAACLGAFAHSLYELWKNYQPKKQVYHLDEFEDKDDPFAIPIPCEHVRLVDKVFDTVFELAAWVNGNIPDERRQEEIMQNGLTYKKLTGIYRVSFFATPEERAWIL